MNIHSQKPEITAEAAIHSVHVSVQFIAERGKGSDSGSDSVYGADTQ